MFLDAALGLSLWGPILAFAVFLVVLSAIAVLVLGVRSGKKGRKLLSWLMITPASVVLLLTAAFFISAFADVRSQKEILIDLKKSQSSVLADLKSACPTSETSSAFCDSKNYTYNVRVVFPDDTQLSVATDTIHWSEDEAKTIRYISLMGTKSHPLQVGRELLLKDAATFSDASNPQTRQEIDKAAEWVVKCCKDNAVYSEVYSVKLRPQLGLELRKNIDEVRIDYSITPGP